MKSTKEFLRLSSGSSILWFYSSDHAADAAPPKRITPATEPPTTGPVGKGFGGGVVVAGSGVGGGVSTTTWVCGEGIVAKELESDWIMDTSGKMQN